MGRLIALGAQGDGICVVMWELLKTCARSAVRVASRRAVPNLRHRPCATRVVQMVPTRATHLPRDSSCSAPGATILKPSHQSKTLKD
jgi:hypothetical protein